QLKGIDQAHFEADSQHLSRAVEPPGREVDSHQESTGPPLNLLRWAVLEPTSMVSSEGSTLTRQPDGSILATGENPLHDRYTIVTASGLPKIAAIRLEAIPDPRFPRGGSGRAVENGNFSLSEFSVHVERSGVQPPTPIDWRRGISNNAVPAVFHYKK